MKTTNYFDTFIAVADDSKVQQAEIPPVKKEKTIANLHFEMIHAHPYKYSSDDVIFGTYVQKNAIPENEHQEAHDLFFSKGQACLRSSPLGKRYGWGIHHDKNGKVALYPIESSEYQDLLHDEKIGHTKSMRSKRA